MDKTRVIDRDPGLNSRYGRGRGRLDSRRGHRAKLYAWLFCNNLSTKSCRIA